MFDLICQLSAPPYAITSLSNGYFIVAGGGGAAKTGVKNFVSLYQLRKRDSGEFYAILLHEYVPTGCAIMNFAALGQAETCLLLLGEDTFCKEYLLKRRSSSSDRPHVDRSRTRTTSGTLRYRGLSMSEDVPSSEDVTFELIELRRVQTCSKPQSITPSRVAAKKKDDDVYQTCVRLSKDLTYLVTGGSDGQVNVFRYVDDVLPAVHSFRVTPVSATGGKIGLDEIAPIEDLDVSPSFGPQAEMCIVAAGSARSAVHRVADCSLLRELALDERAAADCSAFRFRNVRYSVYVSDELHGKTKRNHVLLVSTHRRIRVARGDRRAFLVAAWSCNVYGPANEGRPGDAAGECGGLKRILYPFVGCIRVYDDEPATLAVNDNGHLVGVGTQEGAVHVLRVAYTHVDGADGRTLDARASFSTVYRVREAHSTFVTGITFLPSAVSEQERCEALILSQSVDLRVLAHAVKSESPKRVAFNRLCTYSVLFARLLVALFALAALFFVAARSFVTVHQHQVDEEMRNWTTSSADRLLSDSQHQMHPSDTHSEL